MHHTFFIYFLCKIQVLLSTPEAKGESKLPAEGCQELLATPQFLKWKFCLKKQVLFIIFTWSIPCDWFGSGISTGRGSFVCGSQAPANKPWRWLEMYLRKKKEKSLTRNCETDTKKLNNTMTNFIAHYIIKTWVVAFEHSWFACRS